MENQIEIYQSPDGQTQIDVNFEKETAWMSQKQMAELFAVDVRTINEHLVNIYKTKELSKELTIRKIRIVQKEGHRSVSRNVDFYNLDVIIGIGYRVNSSRATQFRQWATQRLKDYLIQGYAINEKRLAQKQQEIHILKDGIRILSRAIEEKVDSQDNLWLSQFAKGLELLDDYDHESLDQKGTSTQKARYPSIEDYQQIIHMMKADFDSGIFGKEKDEGFQSSVIQISKGFDEEDFYPTLEEKAATLLYLVIKNHSFVDGNKRIAAACFLLFLKENSLLTTRHGGLILSNEALASLTLFVAASKPEEMETVKRLIISVLNRNQ